MACLGRVGCGAAEVAPDEVDGAGGVAEGSRGRSPGTGRGIALGRRRPRPSFVPLPDSFMFSKFIVGTMSLAKAAVRRREAERREWDVIREALRRRKETPFESLQVLSAHNEAILKLNRARR